MLHKNGLTDMAKLMNLQVNEDKEEEEKKNNKERKLMNEDILFIKAEPVPDRKQGPRW